jgi:hypothetical protein
MGVGGNESRSNAVRTMVSSSRSELSTSNDGTPPGSVRGTKDAVATRSLG